MSDGSFIEEDEVKQMNDFPINSVTVGNAAIRRLLPKNYTVV